MKQVIDKNVGRAVRATAMPVALGMRWMRGRSHGDVPEIPKAEWSPALVSKVALDDVFYASELLLATIVSLRHRERLAREIEESVELHQKRGWFDDPRSFHGDPAPIRDYSVSDRDGAFGPYCELQYESGYEPFEEEPGRDRWLGYRSNEVAHVRLLEHPGPTRPWVLCIPGYRMGHALVDFAGFKARWLHRTLGLNVAIPVMPLHGPRVFGRRGGDGFLSGDFVDTLHAHTQAVWDTRRAIAWLRSERGAEQIGAYGVSLGSYTAALLSSVEEGLDCVIAGVPVVDFVRLLRSHMPKIALGIADRLHFPFDELEALLKVASPLAMPTHVDADRRFIYAGTVDSLAVPGQAVDLWRHWEKPRLEWYQGGHVSFIWEAGVKSLVHEALATSGFVEQPNSSEDWGMEVPTKLSELASAPHPATPPHPASPR